MEEKSNESWFSSNSKIKKNKRGVLLCKKQIESKGTAGDKDKDRTEKKDTDKKRETDNNLDISRRKLIKTARTVSAITIVPSYILGRNGEASPNDKLNIACIGVGGKGFDDVRNVMSENIVALCDVDDKRGSDAFNMFPRAKRYKDFRKLLNKEEKNIDAVVVATPDHIHIPASVMAMRMGKHCYCEKPFGHNIEEVRLATEVAQKARVATQLGNSAHSGKSYRTVAALIKAGTIGKVKEVHTWCDKAWAPGDRPGNRPPVPKYLDWDLWLGPAPVRPYHPCYHPLSWRNWWDFGNGRLGDMGCHMIDLPFMSLDLKYPLTVEAKSKTKAHRESSPVWLISQWTFPARGDHPPIKLIWYDGNKRPSLQKEHNMPDWPEGVLFVGSKGMLIATYGKFKLLPEEKFDNIKKPRLPRSVPHAQEWINACKTGSSTGCDFGYAGPLTETVLLGTVAYRAGEKLQWDAENLKVKNNPEADKFIRRENRKGWKL